MPPSSSSSPTSTPSRSLSPKQIDRRSPQAKRVSRAKHPRRGHGYDLLGRYGGTEGRAREVVALPGAAGSVLVVDRDSSTLGDPRLVAHLAGDEPPENAAIVGGLYLQDSGGRWSRPVTPEDLERAPFVVEHSVYDRAEPDSNEVELSDRNGYGHRLEILTGQRCRLWVRWCRHSPAPARVGLEVVSVRDVIGYMESYEPARRLTVEMIAAYRGNREVSVLALGLELERVDQSSFVLNRGLRERALEVVERQGLSMSQIAMRCGHVKYDPRGRMSGETTWLARRLGIVPCSGESVPTPWVRSDVLGLIAREGLRISPREVELG
jgi:hypothetical protein